MDDTAAGGAAPFRFPAPRHTAQWLPSCTPSKWDETGTTTATPGRSTACRYEGWSARVAFFDQLNHLALNRPERRLEQCPAWIEHDVPFRRKLSAVQTERFAQAALDAVAKNRFSDRSRHGEPDARAQLFLWSCAGQACACFCFGRACVCRIRLARLAEGGEQRAGDAESVIINMPEIGGAENPGRPRKGSLAAGGSSRRARSGRFFRRSRSACGAPGRGAVRAPPGRPWSPSWSEIRASWRAFDCSVVAFFWAFSRTLSGFRWSGSGAKAHE